MMEALIITGETYPARRALRAAGATWSYDEEAWLAPLDKREAVEAVAEERGFDVAVGEVDDDALRPLTYAERRALKRAKKERKADRLASSAETHARKAGEYRQKADAGGMNDYAAITQPITNNAGGRAFARRKERSRRHLEREHEHRKEARQREAKAGRLINQARPDSERTPAFMQRRIEEAEAEIRKIDRMLDGSDMVTRGNKPVPGSPYHKRLTSLRGGEVEKRDYWQGLLDEAGGIAYSRETVGKGDIVLIRGQLRRVIRANPKTVTTEVIEGGGIGMVLKYPYAEIQDHRPAGGGEPSEE